MEPLGEKRKK